MPRFNSYEEGIHFIYYHPDRAAHMSLQFFNKNFPTHEFQCVLEPAEDTWRAVVKIKPQMLGSFRVDYCFHVAGPPRLPQDYASVHIRVWNRDRRDVSNEFNTTRFRRLDDRLTNVLEEFGRKPEQVQENAPVPKDEMYVHYSISEDRSGNEDDIKTRILSVLGEREQRKSNNTPDLSILAHPTSNETPDLSILSRLAKR